MKTLEPFGNLSATIPDHTLLLMILQTQHTILLETLGQHNHARIKAVALVIESLGIIPDNDKVR